MDLYECIANRRSIRRYKEKPIPDDLLRRVLNAGRLAPSAVNLQPWKFIVIRSSEARRALVECSRGGKQLQLAMGPLTLVACGNEQDCYQHQGNYLKTFAIDVAIALEHIILAAAAEGLGTCWIGAFDEKAVKDLLHVPDPWRVVAMTPLGYPDESPAFRGRKALAEILCYEKWDED